MHKYAPKTANRNTMLAQIHIGKAALNLSDDDYRSLMSTICGVDSAAKLDVTGLQRFLDHLIKCARADAKNPAAQKFIKRTPGGGARRSTLDLQQRKAVSLWYTLADAGVVRDRSFKALETWVKAHTGVDKLEWLNGAQLNQVIEQLKLWLQRTERQA